MVITLTEHERRRFIAWLESERALNWVVARMAQAGEDDEKFHEVLEAAAAQVIIRKLKSIEQTNGDAVVAIHMAKRHMGYEEKDGDA